MWLTKSTWWWTDDDNEVICDWAGCSAVGKSESPQLGVGWKCWWVCVCVCRTAAEPCSAAALWGSCGTFYGAAASCWWRNCRATALQNPAAPSKTTHTPSLWLYELSEGNVASPSSPVFVLRPTAWSELLPWITWTKPAMTRSRWGDFLFNLCFFIRSSYLTAHVLLSCHVRLGEAVISGRAGAWAPALWISTLETEPQVDRWLIWGLICSPDTQTQPSFGSFLWATTITNNTTRRHQAPTQLFSSWGFRPRDIFSL